MKMNDWGNQSVPSLLAPNELKNHQVIKEEVRHFVAPGSQRPIYGRNNSLPNMKRGESRWQSSSTSSESTPAHLARNSDSPPAFRGVHSPSSVRKQLLSSVGSSSSSEANSKMKRVNHKKGDSITASAAPESRMWNSAENGKTGSPRRSKRIRDFPINSAHESRTRKSLLEHDDDGDDDDFFGPTFRSPDSQDIRSYDRVRFSSLFEYDSFTGSFPLGGLGKSGMNDDGFGALSTRSLEPTSTHSPGAGTFGGSPLTQKKQPRKSAMRKPSQGGSTASSVSSLSIIAQDHADESPRISAKKPLSGPTDGASVSNLPVLPVTKKMDARWESDLPTDLKSSPTTSPKVPGRAVSEGSISLQSVTLPLTGDSEIHSSSIAAAEADGIGSTKEPENSLSNKLCEGTGDQDIVKVPLHQETSRVLPNSQATACSGLATCGDMALKDDSDVGSAVQKRARRRGSTGALAQKWEELFPSRTPILPQSAPTTPKDSARKRFNHRRRGSFGIYANVAHEDDEPLPPKIPPATKTNDDDEYDLFLQSGATGDFATWLEQHRKEKEISTSTSPSIHPKSLVPPTQRRGSTGALAQRWEQELLPALQAASTATIPPLTATSISSRRESESVREKLRPFGSLTQSQSDKSPATYNADAKASDEVSPIRRDSKRRGSMAALVEKWEKLTTPAGSPKDNITTANVPLLGIVDLCNEIPFHEEKSERCEPSSLDVTSEGLVAGKAQPADGPPDLVPCEKPFKVTATKQKRRGSTGALTAKSRKEPKEGQITKTSSGKDRNRRVSMGYVDDKPTEKKKKVHRDKGTGNNPSKKKASAEPPVDNVPLSSPPFPEQVAGEGSMEVAHKKSPRTSPKTSPTLSTKHHGDSPKSRKATNATTTKVKASKHDLVSSKSGSDSHSSRTCLTVASDLDTSKRSTTGGSQSKRTRSIKVASDSIKVSSDSSPKTGATAPPTTAATTSISTKVKKRSTSVGAIKHTSKKSNSHSSRSQSATRLISAADALAIKQKKHLPGKIRRGEAEVAVTVA